MSIDANTKRKLTRKLAEVAEEAGIAVLNSKIKIEDTHEYKQHEESSIDIVARTAVIKGLEEKIPHLQGNLKFELLPYGKILVEKDDKAIDANLLIDEIDGTTNTKRAMASSLEVVPKAGVCIALSTGDQFSDLQIGVIYTLDTKEVFAGVRIEDDIFYAFKNKEIIYPEDVCKMRGDSKYRVLVTKYSNSKRLEIAEIEQALWDVGYRPYEGCRSSSMDILDIARNEFDAYVDIRALFPENCGAQLQAYDVAAVIPIALGLGLEVSDVFGNSWQSYNEDSVLPLVVCRKEIFKPLMEAIKPIVEKISQEHEYKKNNK